MMEKTQTQINFITTLMQIASSQKGLEEIPRNSNWGKNVQKYLNSVGINFPASWCMAFVYWCYNETFKSLNLPNPLTCSGGVLNVWNSMPVSYRVNKPQRGDIFIMDFGSGHGHTGIVTGNVGKYILTMEGNSNENGSREGYEVVATPTPHLPNGRLISSCKGFLRPYINLMP